MPDWIIDALTDSVNLSLFLLTFCLSFSYLLFIGPYTTNWGFALLNFTLNCPRIVLILTSHQLNLPELASLYTVLSILVSSCIGLLFPALHDYRLSCLVLHCLHTFYQLRLTFLQVAGFWRNLRWVDKETAEPFLYEFLKVMQFNLLIYFNQSVS